MRGIIGTVFVTALTTIVLGFGVPSVQGQLDTTGPYMLSANVLEEPTRTNRILVTWNEKLNLPPGVCVPCATNFSVGSGGLRVPVTSVQYNPTGGAGAMPATVLSVGPDNWQIGSDYYILASWVRDLNGLNVMAPNSVIGVGWPATVNSNVMDYNAVWEYHTDWGNLFNPDPTIYQQLWYATNYNTATNMHWSSGCGVVYKDVQPTVPCRGELGPGECGALGSYVRNPTLFRSSFVVPSSLATDVTLRVTTVVDDAYVLYLNGTEIRRENILNEPAGTLVTENTRAQTEAINAVCSSNNISVTLKPGTNIIAAAVCQFNAEGMNGGDTYWGLRLDVTLTSYRTSLVPTGGLVRLTGTRVGTNQIRLSWPTNIYNYALEFTTNITTVGQNTVLGPWFQAQTNMAIGMITNYPPPAPGFISGPAYIFRLRKVP